ncbi:hypothetical protein EVG20_g9043 [Dentipellis fragilis]|uniref:non-specific serine/threonine protein kinase n=1 Tax=Dentipellis fragilis TaxID=205917 RepID=A0A4Y9Y5P1_9AGAM|nr:hypothetical protein EVG20_g9043 [Dentipellis fragilis]
MQLGHKHTGSSAQNQKAQLATAYNELGRELSSSKIKVVGNYTLGKVIGEGTYGKVRMGTHRLSSTRVAIKQIPKALSSSLTREIHHHRQLHHPHVTQLYEIIATESSIWLVTELCSGGELFDYLTEKGRLSEDETRIIFGQLCLAVNYVHEKGIVHRDLKLENVLLDERCRVKLGDFGFTREFEKGTYMETFCGTTGYASPEMLEGRKYLGPEVDVWSLGVILYCLLTGTLPFDDDDESVMREKVIRGEFEDPEWLSDDVRDLIQNVLQRDPVNRLTIQQILAHPWFTNHVSLSRAASPSAPNAPAVSSFSTEGQATYEASGSSVTSESTYGSVSSEMDRSSATTPDEESLHEAGSAAEHKADDYPLIHRNPSQSTIKKSEGTIKRASDGKTKKAPPETVLEEEVAPSGTIPSRLSMNRSSSRPMSPSSKGPPALPTRTPVRTKRRSVSSTLSDPASPTSEKHLTPLPPQDFASLLNTPAPIIFGTPLERALLNNLSSLGFDTGQMVHSVLSNACDSTGAVWWMLKRKAEKKAVEEGDSRMILAQIEERDDPAARGSVENKRSKSPADGLTPLGSKHPPSALASVQSAPELALIPATPTVPTHNRPQTPPRNKSPNQPFLSPTPAPTDSGAKSHPSTPAGSVKDKDEKGSKGRQSKARSGSVSIMQRATTALEAAGLVRKKSSEAVKDEKGKHKEKDKDKDKDKETEHEKQRSSTFG